MKRGALKAGWIASLAGAVTLLGVSFLYLKTGFGPAFVALTSSALLLFFLSYRWNLRLKEEKKRVGLRKAWGVPDGRKRDYDELSLHFGLTREEGRGGPVLDDRTWNDLDMDLIHSSIDRTLTVPGEQFLYSILRRPLLDSRPLEERNRWIRLFSEHPDLREKVQLLLSGLGRESGESLPGLLWGDDIPTRIPHIILLVIMTAVLPLPIILILLHQTWAWAFLLAVFVGNMIIHYRVKRTTQDHFYSVRYLGRLIAYAEKLTRLEFPGLDRSRDQAAAAVKDVYGIVRKMAWMWPEGSNPFFDYLNIVGLIEVRAFRKVVAIVREHRRQLQDLFEWIGLMDSMMSVASFRSGLRQCCQPRFTESGPFMEFDSAYHPLIDDPVPNSLSAMGGGVLITGSNMSGKTIFLKTIGVNALLAQTVFTCLAGGYRARFFNIMTVIGRKDNVIEGKSYYLDEIQALLRLLRSEPISAAHLFLLDELFRGTNSAERIGASVEVLRYLGKKQGCTFASTHDVEISELIGSEFANVHFQEEVADNGLEFSYKLRQGPSNARNAIRLLRQAGYPEEVVEAAERTAGLLTDQPGSSIRSRQS